VAFDVGVHIDDSFLSLDSTCRGHHWLKFVGSGVVHNCGDGCFSMRDAIATQTAVIVSGGVSIELGGCLSFDDLLSDAAKDDGQRANEKWLHGGGCGGCLVWHVHIVYIGKGRRQPPRYLVIR
jgi:hypothetical protein